MSARESLRLFLRDSDLDRPIRHADGVGGDVHHGGHLHHLPAADVEFRAVPRADDVVSVEFAVAERTVVVRADVADGEEPSRDIEDNDGTVADVHKKTLSVGEFGNRRDLKKFQ